VQESEQELYLFCRRGIQALRDIQPGEILKNGVNFAVLRPGKRSPGMHPRHLAEIEGKMANCKIPMGEGLQFTYLELT
jgi:sialic acid synthase SpsE